MVATLRPRKLKTQPEKCQVGMSCHGECVSKVDPRTRKPKRCSGNSQGFTKESLQWLADKADPRLDKALRSANRDQSRIAAGKGRFSVEKGQVQEEDMSRYLAKQKRPVTAADRQAAPTLIEPSSSLLERPTSAPTSPTEKATLKVASLTAKAEQAEAIASNSSSPETQRRALKIADRFKALAKRVQDWERSRRDRIRQTRLKSSQEAAIASIQAPTAPPTQKEPTKGKVKPPTQPTVTPSNAPTVEIKPKGKSKPKPPTLPPVNTPDDIPSLTEMRGKGKPLGQGQFGIVYRDGDRAIKYSTQGKIDRQEFEIGQRAAELGVGPKMYGIKDIDDRRSAMSMEFIDGSPLLNDDVKRGIMQGQDVDDAINLMATLHRNGISHNDMHPGNLIRGKDGRLQVIDWGRAKVNDPTRVMREFMRPWFITQSYRSDDGSVKNRPYQIKGNSQFATRFKQAQSDFIRQYGKETAKWPTGKQADAAIANFYSKVFG